MTIDYTTAKCQSAYCLMMHFKLFHVSSIHACYKVNLTALWTNYNASFKNNMLTLQLCSLYTLLN